MHDRAGLLPEWAAAELRRPTDTADDLRERIMARVRATTEVVLRHQRTGRQSAVAAESIPV